MVLFEDIKLFYQRSGETKFRDDDGLLALHGGQKVMLFIRDNRPLFVLRYDNITSMSFDEKQDRTLSIQYGGSGASGSARMQLKGKWRQIVETLQAQSGQTITMVPKK